MINNLDTNCTTRFVYFLTVMKQKEMVFYKRKMLELKELLIKNPNDLVNEYKYNLTKMRYDELKITIKSLTQLTVTDNLGQNS